MIKKIISLNKIKTLFAFIAIFSVGFFLAQKYVFAGPTTSLIFSDNFDALNTGTIAGQNGWASAGGGAWTVTVAGGGKTVVGGNSSHNTSPITQTGYSSKDIRLMVDFIAPISGQAGIHTWVRRTSSASTAAGYDLYYFLDGKWYLSYITGATNTVLTSLTMALTSGAWYTVEFEAINDGSGNPVLKGWIYPQNTTKPVNPNITFTDTLKRQPNTGFVGLGGFNRTVTADNVLVYSGADAPSAPSPITTVAQDNQVALSWTAPSNGGMSITDYVIQYRTGSDAYAVFADGTSTTASATVTGLTGGTAYDFKVYAVNAIGNGAEGTVSATTMDSTLELRMTDTFDSLTSGDLSGQNGWTSTGYASGNWQVANASSGKDVNQANATLAYYRSPISQTAHSLDNSRVVVDFKATATGNSPYVWLRRSATGVTANGYALYRSSDGKFYLGYISGSNVTALTSTTFSLTSGSWYTVEFEIIDNSDGNPVLKGWAYTQGGLKPATPTITYTDSSVNQITSAGYSGLGTQLDAGYFDNFSLYATDPASSPPGVPTSLSTTPGNTDMLVSWTAPVNVGGSPIIDYIIEYRTGSNTYAVFADGTSTSTSATVTGLYGGTLYDFKVYAVNSNGSSSASTISDTTIASNITITSPARSVTADPNVATIGIVRSECSATFYIPYIQTSDSITVTATVLAPALPVGGGVKFVLTDQDANETTIYDLTSSFSATFTSLAKGEYTLDVYIVNSSQVVQSGSINHDMATNIGVGDIFVAIGDSTTEGYDGTAYDVSPYTSWIDTPVHSTDNRNYPQCGTSTGASQDHWQKVSHHISLNNVLGEFYDYPVFILNEGFAGITSSGYNTRTGLTTWQNRINALAPNKWLVHLGINDLGGSAGFQSNMQTLMETLINTYGADSSNIYLAVPSARNNWQPYINNLISINSLSTGPDFKTFYTGTGLSMVVGLHPNVTGHQNMGRLWGISVIYPKNFSATQFSSDVQLTWDDLSTVESSIAGYKIYYGTDPASLSTIVDVGDVTSHSITSGLTPGQTYYFAIRGYDDDASSLNYTARSGIESLLYTTPDVTDPVISNIVSSPSDTSVTITFDTDEASDTQIEYGTTVSYGSTTTLDATLVTSHSALISSLSPNTTYHYRIITADASNNTTTSSDQTFTTDSTPDTTPPVRSSGAPSGAQASGTTSVNMTLTTDENATCKYGTSSGVAYASIASTFSTTGSTSHSQTIGSLSDGNSYTYYVRCQDSSTNANTTDYSISFSVSSPSDTTPPTISNISASPSLTSAVITFDTDEASDTQIEYGTTTSYGSTTTLDATLVTSHSASVTGLSPSTIYHYRIITTDASNNTQTSSDQTFTTDSDTTPGPDLGSSNTTYSSYSKTSKNGRNTKNQNTNQVINQNSVFTRNLQKNDSGEDVRRLQDFLIKKKLLLIDKSTGYFGPLTFKALVNYQKSAGITPTSGFFGPITRGVVSEVLKTMK